MSIIAARVGTQRSPNARGIAVGSLGLLGLAAGPIKFPVFVHGVVLSIFPPDGPRTLVALTIWSEAAATALGLVVYGEVLDRGQEPADSEPIW